jgi:hypothetical protein
MEEVIKYGSDRNAVIEKLQMFLNREPKADTVKINSMANNSKYIPIAEVERTLDEVYSGLWSTVNFRWEVVANEIVGSIDLKVINPANGFELVRTGCASVMIQIERGKEVNVINKIKNTLVKDFPHLKAECIKNAAKSLGVAFGRNLNRDSSDYQPLSEQIGNLEEATMLLTTARLADGERAVIERRINKASGSDLVKAVEYLRSKQ